MRPTDQFDAQKGGTGSSMRRNQLKHLVIVNGSSLVNRVVEDMQTVYCA